MKAIKPHKNIQSTLKVFGITYIYMKRFIKKLIHEYSRQDCFSTASFQSTYLHEGPFHLRHFILYPTEINFYSSHLEEIKYLFSQNFGASIDIMTCSTILLILSPVSPFRASMGKDRNWQGHDVSIRLKWDWISILRAIIGITILFASYLDCSIQSRWYYNRLLCISLHRMWWGEISVIHC